MKNNIFRVRKIGEPLQTFQPSQISFSSKKLSEADYLKISIQRANQKLVDLMGLFETFMKTSLQQAANKSACQGDNSNHFGTVEREVRDRHVQFYLPEVQKLTKQDAQKWMTEVCVTTFSTSFHYYLTQQMSIEQTKVFCSQNILRNLLRLTQKFKLTDKELQNLNKHIGGKVIQYLQKKYPKTQSNDVNKALQKQVQQTNHLDLLTNDFLYNSGIMFKYSQDGNYNDMIMKVMNKIIQLYEEKSLLPYNRAGEKNEEEEQSNYRDFSGFMSNLFESVYDQRWMAAPKEERIDLTEAASYIVKKVNVQNHKEKYQQKVKSYTNYSIGRKISENTVPYTQGQINSKNLIIKSPAILRILTKWCQQLWQKFEKETYFTEITESIQLQDPQIISPFYKWMKTAIDSLAIVQKKNILAFKAQLDRNSYNQQSEFLLKHLQEDNITSIPKYQKATGKFATQMVKNLHSYIILYLNRLIHGLLTISKKFYDVQVDKTWDDWHAPPNLVTFKIGDLLRCKMSSKQKQIVRIFKQIKKISSNNPKKLKIVRIKNRLKEGTNDLLINIKFNNLIICEIQLQVINKSKSKFIQSSNNISHYIYELQRSIFGPISELCNIWTDFQARAAQYESLIKMPKTAEIKSQQCISQQTQHDLVKFDLPFQCSYCQRLYYHNNYIISNKKCQKCCKYKCVKCQINDMEESELKKTIFTSKKEKNIADCSKKNNLKDIPKIGVCVKIESTNINIQVFQFTKYQGKTRLLAIKQGQIYNVKTIKSQKDTEDFLDKYCVFEVIMNSTNFINITDKLVQKYSIETYLQETYKQQKQVLILTQIDYTAPQMVELMKVDGGYERSKRNIKRLQFASNYASNIQYFQCFQNLTSINLDSNEFRNMKHICKFKALEKLQMRQNKMLDTFDQEVCELQRLQQIKINGCKIEKLPSNINNLSLLSAIKMDKNYLKTLPDSICKMTNLKEISFKQNALTSLPQDIGNLRNLKKLILKGNQLKSVPKSLASLSKVQLLDLSQNDLKELPDGLMNLHKLETLRLQRNQLEKLPPSILQNQFLKSITLHGNKLKALPNTFNGCKNIKNLTLHKNEIEMLPQTLKQCVFLQELSLYQNKLQEIPSWFSVFKRLPHAHSFQHNQLKDFPTCLFQFEDITSINLSHNQIVMIPNKIHKLQELKSLDLGYNAIQVIPSKLEQLTNLLQGQLHLDNNPLKKVECFKFCMKYGNPQTILCLKKYADQHQQ